MKTHTYGLLALAAAAKLASAHTTVFAAWINDEDQGLGNSADGYIRSPPNNDPVKDVTSTDMTCNVNGATAAGKTLSVKSGDKFTFEWHHNGRDSSDDIIASSHLGPVMVYLAPTEKGSSGSGWVKIAEEGYADGKWAVDNLIANKGKHSVTIPDIPAGKYLLRPEIIALHEGNREGGAQFYMECVQIEVTSDGANTLPEGVSIPGAYTATDKGVLFDIYSTFDSYPIPGPAVWDGASSGSSGSGSTASSSSAAVVAETTAAAATTSAAVATSAASTPATSAAPATTAAPEVSTSAAPVATSTAYETENVAETTYATVTATPTPAVETPTTPSVGGAVGGAVKKYQRCGGKGYSGATSCEDGTTCKQWNDYYSQCVESS
ncbi:Cellulose-binding domain fungal [Botryosphaeria dothidea]|uniref:AA9 family lytic polysaccharide monooxygenase n=1 Tax=Botryosphaeria dothidea TaxID=55169 RepID=A0A8H4IP04_9PEZI|nr:Cellulose-binding domain fungal [Botryosphaeria dothidea]